MMNGTKNMNLEDLRDNGTTKYLFGSIVNPYTMYMYYIYTKCTCTYKEILILCTCTIYTQNVHVHIRKSLYHVNVVYIHMYTHKQSHVTVRKHYKVETLTMQTNDLMLYNV